MAGLGIEPLVDHRAVGTRLKELRKQRSATQTDMALVLGVRQNTISDYERGRLQLNPEHIARLIQEYKITFEWLCLGK